ncbi:MAG: acyl-CoA thioesterase [Candidatus Dormibacteraeota bacterium]|nr:acyl-CoA thioesterase [Candidatus Dormibacteraeota bacterium]
MKVSKDVSNSDEVEGGTGGTGPIDGRPEEPANPASVVIQRRVEWPDTDAGGLYQYQSVFRWIEAAEAVLHERLGIVSETFGSSPRAHVEATYRLPLRFLDTVDVELTVAAIGRTSVRYEFSVRKDGEVHAYGSMTSVHTTGASDRPEPWPRHVRQALEQGGTQPDERVG